MHLIEHGYYREDIKKVIKHIPESCCGKSILITGASGLIGSFLVDTFAHFNRQRDEGKIDVYALARDEKRLRERFFCYTKSDKVHFLVQDVRKPLLCAASNFDYILHAASNTHPVAYATDPIGTITTNITGLQNLLEYSIQHPAGRIVFFSSVEVYGENRGDTDTFAENYCGHIDCNTMRAGYPESKRLCESLCQAYIHQKGMDIVMPRLPRTYGPAMLQSDTKALSQFIRYAVRKENIILKSRGSQLFSYGYMADVAAAILDVMYKGGCGEAYNIADSLSDISLRELAEILAAYAGTKVVFELPSATEAAGYSTATKAVMNADKIAALGWTAKYDICAGLRRTVDMLKETQRASR